MVRHGGTAARQAGTCRGRWHLGSEDPQHESTCNLVLPACLSGMPLMRTYLTYLGTYLGTLGTSTGVLAAYAY